MSVYALILAGGAGTRFWPASRVKRPKQLLPLTGSRPLIVETIDRILPLTGGWERIFIASGTSVADATRAMLPDLLAENLLVEPIARNTAPCIAWAASTIARLDPYGVVIVLPSDHHIEDNDAFRAALAAAVESAKGGTITTIGLAPTRPDTGFGYIEVAEELGATGTAPKPVDVVRFTEKPTREIAETFVAGKKHLWNGGMFIFRARDMVAAVERHMPDWAAELRLLDDAAAGGTESEILATAFSRAPSVSIDYAIMEKMERLAVVPATIGWSDVGSWEAAAALVGKDEAGNAGPKSSVFVDAERNYVVDLTTKGKTTREKVIALVGVHDLCVVETDDALLIVPRSSCQDVKLVVDALKARGDTDHV